MQSTYEPLCEILRKWHYGASYQSPLFSKYPKILSDHHVIEFITDYLRLMVGGNLNPLEIENLMDG